MLHVRLCNFQITHGVKQCATCQHTTYHDTINYSLNCFSHLIYVLQTSTYQNIAKLFSHSNIFPNIFFSGMHSKSFFEKWYAALVSYYKDKSKVFQYFGDTLPSISSIIWNQYCQLGSNLESRVAGGWELLLASYFVNKCFIVQVGVKKKS